MSGRTQPRCGDCAEEIVWGFTTGGNHIPLNKKPDTAGNFACRRDVHGTLRARIPTEDNPADSFEHMHMPHAATCKKRAGNQPVSTAQTTLAVTVTAAVAEPLPLFDNVVPISNAPRYHRG